MAQRFPYTYISCPCADTPSTRELEGQDEDRDNGEEENRTFDPRAPRSNYSLYPMEHLLYCEDCHQIRCPRCVLDEVVCWYCPSCLFEVPNALVKAEGNRCTRNCYTCPVCTAPLSVSAVEPAPSTQALAVPKSHSSGPYVLACPYCMWSSREVGLEFEKPNNITGQLAKLKKKRGVSPSGKEDDNPLEKKPSNDDSSNKDDPSTKLSSEEKYSNLKSFYSKQITETSAGPGFGMGNDFGFGSPGALSRIMGLYTGVSHFGKKAKTKSGVMREAYGRGEGMEIIADDQEIIEKMKTLGWDGLTSVEQRSRQPKDARFLEDVMPVQTFLRTKRSKRCRTCRHILTKPESKPLSTRFRMRLVAVNYIPTLSLRPLGTPANTPVNGSLPQTLSALTPIQLLLTLRNPLFDPIKVSLATPEQTPGKHSSRVTILCPQFEVGANTDVWDDALARPDDKTGQRKESIAEAGKIWEKGRNWTTVVIEVSPARIGTGEVVDEDEDVLEIPLFVHVEYETDAGGDEEVTVKEGPREKEKRELAYWSVVGVGQIERLGT